MRPAAGALLAPILSMWAVLAVAGAYPIDNPDTFGHLALGRQIVELGHVPSHDTFSYFRPSPVRFVNYEWLSDTLFFVLYRAAGANGLQLLKLLLSGALSYVLVRSVQLRAAQGATWLVPLLVLAGLPGVRFRWSVRPHLFGTLFGALYLLGLGRLLATDSPRERRAWLAGLALCHVLWVNLHGSHLLGLAFTGLACLCCLRDRARLRWLVGLLGLLLAASCVSPYGPAIVEGAIEHTLDPRYRTLVEEWRPYRLSQSLWFPAIFCLQLALLSAGALVWRGASSQQLEIARRLRVFDVLCALLLLLMAARSLRFLSDALLLTVPMAAIWLAPRPLAWSARRRATLAATGGMAALGIAIAGCLALPPQRSFGLGETSRGRPEGSARWLARHWPDARVMAELADGWDLMFSLPRARFLLDGRSTFYGPEHLARVQRAWSAPAELRELLDATATDVVVAQPIIKEQQSAIGALLGAPDFRLMAIEAEHCVFARARPELDPLALRVLQPGYDTAWLTAPGLDLGAVQRELARLPRHPNVQPYAAWVRALGTLRPLLREGGAAGITPARDERERSLLEAALRDLRVSHEALPLVQTVAAYRGLVAALSCELDEARAAFARASTLGSVRETLLGGQELALREGRTHDVREFLALAGTMPGAAQDAWLAALQQELAENVRCPP